MSTASESSEPQAPVLRVITPDATPEEIAVLTAVFASMGGSAAPAKKPVPAWASHRARLRPPHPHGPGGWRASGQQR